MNSLTAQQINKSWHMVSADWPHNHVFHWEFFTSWRIFFRSSSSLSRNKFWTLSLFLIKLNHLFVPGHINLEHKIKLDSLISISLDKFFLVHFINNHNHNKGYSWFFWGHTSQTNNNRYHGYMLSVQESQQLNLLYSWIQIGVLVIILHFISDKSFFLVPVTCSSDILARFRKEKGQSIYTAADTQLLSNKDDSFKLIGVLLLVVSSSIN